MQKLVCVVSFLFCFFEDAPKEAPKGKKECLGLASQRRKGKLSFHRDTPTFFIPAQAMEETAWDIASASEARIAE